MVQGPENLSASLEQTVGVSIPRSATVDQAAVKRVLRLVLELPIPVEIDKKCGAESLVKPRYKCGVFE